VVESTEDEDRHVRHPETRNVRDPEIRLLVIRWRARAQELLAEAETMHDAEARQTMREIAAKYERLAQQIEQQAGRAGEV
jgi:hypothetical protein